MKETVNKRNANMELLRLISMLMVVFLHGLWKGENLQGGSVFANTALAWIFECLSIVAVNVFMLISGYFMSMSRFRLERLISLVLQTVFYSLGVFLVCGALGLVDYRASGTYEILGYVFPLNMGIYWFITSYVIVYVLSPLINRALKYVSSTQLATVIFILLAYESLLKTVLPFRLEDDDNGYSAIWFLTVYLIGAYFRKYGFRFLKTTFRGMLMYVVCAGLIFAETMALTYISDTTGHFSEIKTVAIEYNHVFNILAATGIFAAFINMKEMKGILKTVVLKLSPLALGVYLLHESPSIRYEWQKWVGVYDIKNLGTLSFVGHLFLGVLIVFAAGLSIDFVRKTIFDLAGRLLSKTKLYALIVKINESVNKINEGK